jgi:hypothetical protein
MKTYSLFNSRRLNTNIELALYIALIRSVMIDTYLTWEYAAHGSSLETAMPAEESTTHCGES